MGSHFRTSGEPQQGFDPVDDVLDPSPQPAPTAPAGHFSYEPVPAPSFSANADVDESEAVPAHASNVFDPPAVSPASTGVFMPVNIPDPAAPASSVMNIPDPAALAAPRVTADQAAEVAHLNAALADPGFTSVFAPLGEDDAVAHRRKMAQQAGVEPVILMEHVTKVYPAQPNKPALDDINIEIYPGEFVFLVGHSGSGKTTLLNTMLRNVKPTSGRVLVAGQDLMKLKNRKVPFLRRQIGAVFQDYKLLPNKTAYENVAFALQCIGKPRGVIRAQVPEVLRLVGLGDQMDSLPDQLSGGEQQRVSVARAMVNRPPLLICDEPTGNLDPAISLGIMKLLERINRTGTTVIVATHDREMVDSMHRRVIALEAGHVVRDQERGGYGNYGTF